MPHAVMTLTDAGDNTAQLANPTSFSRGKVHFSIVDSGGGDFVGTVGLYSQTKDRDGNLTTAVLIDSWTEADIVPNGVHEEFEFVSGWSYVLAMIDRSAGSVDVRMGN